MSEIQDMPAREVAGRGAQPGVLYQVRGVKRSFRLGRQEISVLRGVDLNVLEGDFLAIKGSSGTGKSTLLHILGLLDRPDAGTLIYGGSDLAGASERRRTAIRAVDFGFVFQFYYLLPEFDTVENVCMPALIARGAARSLRGRNNRKQRRERALHLLECVGLAHRLGHRPGELSGGERQRVAIARALMNEPRIVFCDEPTGNLDMRTAAGIHDLLARLNQDLDQTMVVVTHEESMTRVVKRSLEMVDGVILGGSDEEAPR